MNPDYANGNSEQEMRGKTALIRDQNSSVKGGPGNVRKWSFSGP